MVEHKDRARFAEWARMAEARGDTPAVAAATLVLVTDRGNGIETLMLRKNSKITFGGMWVFPGGRVDDTDRLETATGDTEAAARAAAVRETREETEIGVEHDVLEWFAHWVPPPIAPKRFSTWFFAAEAPSDAVTIDGGEIHDAEWMRPTDALRRRDAQELELAPPTWVTLHHLARHDTVTSFLDWARRVEPRFYETHIGSTDEGPVALWEGDAGYETGDATIEGPRHRLVMALDGYRFEETDPAT